VFKSTASLVRNNLLGGEKMNKKKPAMCILLVAILLSAFLLVSPVVAEESGYQTFQFNRLIK